MPFVSISLPWHPQSSTTSPLVTHRFSRQSPRPNLPIISLEEEDMMKQPHPPHLSHTDPLPWPQYLPALHPHQGVQEGPGHQYHPRKWGPGKRGLRAPSTDTDPLQLTNQFHPLSSCWDPEPPSLALCSLPLPPLHRRPTPSSQCTNPNILTRCPFSPGSPGSPSKPRSP